MEQTETAIQEVFCKNDAPKSLAKPTGINTHARASLPTKPQARNQQRY